MTNNDETVTFFGKTLTFGRSNVGSTKYWRGPDGMCIDDCGFGPSRYRAMWNGYVELGHTPQKASDGLEQALRMKANKLDKVLQGTTDVDKFKEFFTRMGVRHCTWEESNTGILWISVAQAHFKFDKDVFIGTEPDESGPFEPRVR